MNNDIPSKQDDLTGDNSQEDPTAGDPMQSGNSDEAGLDPKTKEGFQRLIAKKEREAREATDRALALEKEIKEKKLAELDETDRLKQQNQELAQENAMLKLSQFAKDECLKRGITSEHPLYSIITRKPWVIEEIERSLGDSPTWQQVIQAVEDKLPAYLDSLRFKKGDNTEPNSDTPASDSGSGVDPERQPDPGPKRVWSQREIEKMNPKDYAKHSEEIHRAMVEGRITA